MKYTKAAILLFFSILVQASFLRLIAGIPALPEIPLVILFILSYRLPYFGVLVLAALTGTMIDLFSAVNFGSSAVAALAAILVCYYFRENIFKGKNFTGTLSLGTAVFCCYYLFLYATNTILNFFNGNNFTFNLFDKKLAAEIILGVIAAACFAYLLTSKINYVNIRDYKRFFKISA